MTWFLVILATAGQPAMIVQAQGYATEKICKEARDDFAAQLDAEARKKIRPVCLMTPKT
jgi:hypothetical protein